MWAKILVPTVTFLFGLIVKDIWERITHTKKPRFSFDSAREARRAINSAKSVFNQANSVGGSLPYPWKVNGEEYRAENLQEDIAASKAQIGDKKLSLSLDVVSNQIHRVWVTAYRSIPRVVSDSYPNLQTPEEMDSRNRVAEQQRQASDTGLKAVSDAVDRLDKLSRNL